MSFEVTLGSAEDAKPVDCYRIVDITSGVVHRFTSSNVPVVLAGPDHPRGELFFPGNIKRSSIQYTAKKSMGTLNVTILESGDEESAALFELFSATRAAPVVNMDVIRAYAPNGRTQAQIDAEEATRTNEDPDPDQLNDVFFHSDYMITMPVVAQTQQRRIWTGRLSNSKLKGLELTLVLSAVGDQVARNVPGRKYSWSFGHIWGEARSCKVDISQYYACHHVESITDGKIYLDTTDPTPQGEEELSAFTEMATDPGYFTGGWVQFDSEALGTDKRFIIDGGVEDGQPWLQVSMDMFNFTVGDGNDVLRIYAGCNRSPEDCRTKFNNTPNYGGFPHVPGFNPFMGKGVRPLDDEDPIVFPGIQVDQHGNIEGP